MKLPAPSQSIAVNAWQMPDRYQGLDCCEPVWGSHEQDDNRRQRFGASHPFAEFASGYLIGGLEFGVTTPSTDSEASQVGRNVGTSVHNLAFWGLVVGVRSSGLNVVQGTQAVLWSKANLPEPGAGNCARESTIGYLEILSKNEKCMMELMRLFKGVSINLIKIVGS